MFDPVEEDPNYNPLPEDRPGGFDWGGPPPAQPPGEEQPADDQRNDGRRHEHED